MNQTAVWIDSKEAFILSISGDGRKCEIIASDISVHERIPGEGKAYTRMGDTYMDDDKRKENKKANQTKVYFDQIMISLKTADQIVLFGPAEMKIHLEKEIRANKELSDKLVGVEAAERMSENQLFAWMIDYYKNL